MTIGTSLVTVTQDVAGIPTAPASLIPGQPLTIVTTMVIPGVPTAFSSLSSSSSSSSSTTPSTTVTAVPVTVLAPTSTIFVSSDPAAATAQSANADTSSSPRSNLDVALPGIIVACVVGFLFLVFLIWFFFFRRNSLRESEREKLAYEFASSDAGLRDAALAPDYGAAVRRASRRTTHGRGPGSEGSHNMMYVPQRGPEGSL